MSFVASAPGYPAGTSGGISKYTPQIYAKKLLTKFYEKTVFGEIANRDYEGDISAVGDKVIVRTRPAVEVFDYVKGMDLRSKRKTYEPASTELTIDYAKGYSIALDDIDKLQMDIDALNEWATDASESLGIAIDRSILCGNTTTPVTGSGLTSGFMDYADSNNTGATAGAKSAKYNIGTTSSPITLSKSNILDYIVLADAVLTEQNLPETDRWMIIPAWAKALINTSDLRSALFTGDGGNKNLRNGKMGQISNFTLYSSNNLIADTGASSYWPIPFGHKSALTFASQLVKNRVLELQDTFGTAMEGLHVYGWKVIQPTALGLFWATSDFT
jgi:hypothetical protein